MIVEETWVWAVTAGVSPHISTYIHGQQRVWHWSIKQCALDFTCTSHTNDLQFRGPYHRLLDKLNI